MKNLESVNDLEFVNLLYAGLDWTHRYPLLFFSFQSCSEWRLSSFAKKLSVLHFQSR